MNFQKLTLLLIVTLLTNSTLAYRKGFIAFESKTGDIFESERANEKVYPASLTKLMTAYIILNSHSNLAQKANISKNAWGHKFINSSRMFLEPGMNVSIDDLLKGLLVQSGNDAAIALAEFHSGSTEKFVDVMNNTAKELGMKDTNFENPNGRHNKYHYTTANDFKKLISTILRNTPQITSYTKLQHYSFNDIMQWNRNRTLKTNESLGLKTGFTPQSGFNLAACYQLNNGNFCTIEFGASSIEDRKTRSLKSYEEVFKLKEVYEVSALNKLISVEGFMYQLHLDPIYVLEDSGNKVDAKLIRDKHTNGANSAVVIEFTIGDTHIKQKAKLSRYNQTD